MLLLIASEALYLGLFDGRPSSEVRLQVPLWTNARLDANWPYHMPRYQVFSHEEASQQRGAANIFRVHLRDRGALSCRHTPQDGLLLWRRSGACPCTWTSRCKVPLGVYESHRYILEGLEAMRRFVIACVSQLSEGLTNKAYNADMLQVLDSCDECFDWGFLCFQRPLRRHADAWRRVLGLLKPFLQHSLWPAMSASDYAKVERTWELPDAALLFQYGLLVERVRCVASLAFRRLSWRATFDSTGSNVKTAPEEVVRAAAAEWFSLPSVSVRPLFVLHSIESAVGKKLRSLYISVVSLKKIAWTISLFCGSVAASTLPTSAYQVFQLSPSRRVLSGVQLLCQIQGFVASDAACKVWVLSGACEGSASVKSSISTSWRWAASRPSVQDPTVASLSLSRAWILGTPIYLHNNRLKYLN